MKCNSIQRQDKNRPFDIIMEYRLLRAQFNLTRHRAFSEHRFQILISWKNVPSCLRKCPICIFGVNVHHKLIKFVRATSQE